MKILIVNGKPQSGKDTFCENAFNNCQLIYPISMIDRVKQVALFVGWSGEKDEKARRFLSDLKDAMARYKDIPYTYVKNFIENRTNVLKNTIFFDSGEPIFLVQAREPEDIQRWVEECDAKTLFIYREDADTQWGNHADDEVNNYQYDYILFNDSTLENWENKTIKFINQIKKEKWESHI